MLILQPLHGILEPTLLSSHGPSSGLEEESTMLSVLHALQGLLHGHICGRYSSGHQHFPYPNSGAHLPSPTGHPELLSLVPSAPGSGLTPGSLPEGGQQWLPAPTSDGPGGIRYRVRHGLTGAFLTVLCGRPVSSPVQVDGVEGFS